MFETKKEEYNPFAMMMEFKMFKEYMIPLMQSTIQRSFLDDLNKFELTEEFKAFVLDEHYKSHRGPTDNMYTLYCIYKYLKHERKMEVTDEYKPGISVTPDQILEFSRIIKYYFLMHSTSNDTVNHYIEELTDQGERMQFRLLFDEIRDSVLEILHDEYNNTGMKKEYDTDKDKDKLLKMR